MKNFLDMLKDIECLSVFPIWLVMQEHGMSPDAARMGVFATEPVGLRIEVFLEIGEAFFQKEGDSGIWSAFRRKAFGNIDIRIGIIRFGIRFGIRIGGRLIVGKINLANGFDIQIVEEHDVFGIGQGHRGEAAPVEDVIDNVEFVMEAVHGKMVFKDTLRVGQHETLGGGAIINIAVGRWQ